MVKSIKSGSGCMGFHSKAIGTARVLALAIAFICSQAQAGFSLEGDPTVVPSLGGPVVLTSVPAVGAAPEPVAVPAPKIIDLPKWEVKVSDVTLRQTLGRWARSAGWQLSWEVKVDYPVQLEAIYVGTFDTAVEQFTDALRGSDYPLDACFYSGNRVVRVIHHGDMKVCETQKDFK
jgi:hypothetical protein